MLDICTHSNRFTTMLQFFVYFKNKDYRLCNYLCLGVILWSKLGFGEYNIMAVKAATPTTYGYKSVST